MKRSDDYSDEMFTKRLSDRDIEAILSGGEADDPTLSEVARAFKALDPSRFETSSDKAAAFAQRAAAVARGGESARFAATAPSRRGLSLTPRLATAAVAASLFLAMTGVAAASNSAAPGDALYGIDRALEKIGIGNGAASERIAEANALTEQGRTTEALDLLGETFGTGSDQASDALLRASERLKSEGPGSESSAEVKGKVAEMLEWMATTEFTGKDFGQGVAERARELGSSGENQGQGNQGQGNQGQGQGNQGQGNQGQGNQGQGNQGQGNQGQGQGNSATPPGQSNEKVPKKDK